MATPSNELQQLRDENQKLQKEVEFLRSEMVRLIGHNMDITEKLEDKSPFVHFISFNRAGGNSEIL